MTDTTKPMHTPMVSPISFDTGYLNAADSEVLGRIYMSERAALIVRAVNSFEPMKEALNAGIELKNFFEKSLNAGPMTTDPSREARLLRDFYQKIDLARAALKLAKGE